METFEIILETAEEIAKNYSNWDGDVFDFVSESSAIADTLSSTELQRFHKDFCGSSFSTENTEVFFYFSNKKPTFQVIRREV